jgi:hypothetical protein
MSDPTRHDDQPVRDAAFWEQRRIENEAEKRLIQAMLNVITKSMGSTSTLNEAPEEDRRETNTDSLRD